MTDGNPRTAVSRRDKRRGGPLLAKWFFIDEPAPQCSVLPPLAISGVRTRSALGVQRTVDDGPAPDRAPVGVGNDPDPRLAKRFADRPLHRRATPIPAERRGGFHPR